MKAEKKTVIETLNMDLTTDSLQFVPINEWADLENTFLADWPRGISGYNSLITQKKLADLGLDYGFKAYCPYADKTNGMVALNKKGTLNEIIIQCPKEDTTALEESLVKTKMIDWNNRIMVPYMPDNIRQAVVRVAKRLKLNIEAEDTEPNEVFLLNDKRGLSDLIDLPEDICFNNILDKNDIDIINSTWRNSYDGSIWFFNMLVKAKLGYGLYKKGQLVSWVFINEVGALTHLFTLEEHRKKGYGEMLMKHLCNLCLKENCFIFAYCRKGNTSACNLYKKLGFEKFHEVRWCFLNPQLTEK